MRPAAAAGLWSKISLVVGGLSLRLARKTWARAGAGLAWLCLAATLGFLGDSHAFFARIERERVGISYQAALMGVMRAVVHHQDLAAQFRAGREVRAELARAEDRAERAVAVLLAADLQLTERFFFDPASLASRGLAEIAAVPIAKEWSRLRMYHAARSARVEPDGMQHAAKPAQTAPAGRLELGAARAPFLDAEDHEPAHASLLAQLRRAHVHVGEGAWLLSDPELDSRYLADIATLAIPQLIERLAAVQAMARSLRLAGEVTRQDVVRLSLYATALEDSAARIQAAIASSRAVAATFHGESIALQEALPKTHADFAAAMAALVESMRLLSREDLRTYRDSLPRSCELALVLTHQLWDSVGQSFEMLLAARAAAGYRRLSLLALASLAGFALTLACSRGLGKRRSKRGASAPRPQGEAHAPAQAKDRRAAFAGRGGGS